MIPTDSAMTRFLDSLVRIVGTVVYVVLALFAVSAFVFLSWGAWREGGWIGLSVYWGLILAFALYMYSESR